MTFVKERWQYAVILLIAGLAVYLAHQSSIATNTTTDEIKNLTSGYSYIRYLDYRLELALSPLPKIISSLPIFLNNKIFPIDTPEWDKSDTESIGKIFIETIDTKNARYLSLAAYAILIFLIYKISMKSVGKSWALLPSFLILGETYVRRHTFMADGKIIASIFILASVYYFINSLGYRSKKRAAYSGIFLGLALASAFESIMLVPAFISIAIIIFGALTYKEWGNIDPNIRESHLKIRLNYFIKSIFIMILTSVAVLYFIYFIGSINHPAPKQITEAEIATKSIVTNWLNDNTALRPLGFYALGANIYFKNMPVESNLILKEEILLLIFIGFTFALATWRSIKSLAQSIRYGTTPLIDYLGTNYYEFSLIFTAAMLSILAFKNYSDREFIMLILMPPLLCLGTVSIKKWFAEGGDDLRKNYVLNLQIFAKNILGLSLKTLTLIVFIALYAALIFNN